MVTIMLMFSLLLFVVVAVVNIAVGVTVVVNVAVGVIAVVVIGVTFIVNV